MQELRVARVRRHESLDLAHDASGDALELVERRRGRRRVDDDECGDRLALLGHYVHEAHLHAFARVQVLQLVGEGLATIAKVLRFDLGQCLVVVVVCVVVVVVVFCVVVVVMVLAAMLLRVLML